MKGKTKTQKGITLIALIITIVVLLILAAVAINSIQNDGILGYAQNAADKYSGAQNDEQSILQGYEDWLLQSQGYFKGEAKGTYITVNDVHPNQHDLKVTLTSDTITDFSTVAVSRSSTNLLDISQMLQDNFTDNGDGTYRFTKTSSSRYSGYATVNIPAGIPVTFGADFIDAVITAENSENTLWGEFTCDDGTKLYDEFDKTDALAPFSYEFDKTIVKIRFFVRDDRMNDGDYMIIKNVKINIGDESAYEEYVTPQTVTANADGTVVGLTSLSPNMTLISNNQDVVINCEYREKNRAYSLYGKTIVNFGDSIFGNYRAPEDISTYLADYTGATVYNVGFGGARMSTHNGYWDTVSMYSLADAITSRDFQLQENAIATNTTGSSRFPTYFSDTLSVLKNIDFNKVDIITIAYGTNDFTADKDIENDSNEKDTTTFVGALRYSIETIKATYPNIQIVLCTPMYRFWIDENNEFLYDSNTHENNDGVKLTDFVQAEKEVGSEYNLFVIDNYNDLGINETNRTQYFPSNDGTHPNSDGRKVIAEHMAKKLYEQFK